MKFPPVWMLWLLVPLGILMTGCPSRTPESSGPVVVRYWDKWTGFEAEAMREIVEEFNRSQEDIRVDYLPVSQIERKLMLAIAGGNPPDVAGLYCHLIPAYAENNALMPLDGFLAGSAVSAENYLPVFWEAGRHRGFTWALPTTPSTLALYWNKKLFREAGLDPECPPRSLADLESLNVALLRRGPGGRIDRLGHTPQEPGWWKALWVYWFGGRIATEEANVAIDTAEMRETFRWLESYPGRFGGEALQGLRNGFGNFASPQNAFFEGRVAMVLQGPWLFNFIQQYAPEDFEWGVAPFPSVDPNRLSDVTLAGCDLLVIPCGARHPREAFRFLEYVSSQSVMERLCLGQKKFSPLREVSEDFYARHPNPDIKVFSDLAASPRAMLAPRLITWQECQNALNAAVDAAMLRSNESSGTLHSLQLRLDRSQRQKRERWERIAAARLAEWRERSTP